MKRAVILHGTDASPEANWFPWLKNQLESAGYEVWVPLLPQNHTPNRHTYNDFLFNSGWDFTDNLVIGHSSGAVSILNLLADERCPKIDTAVAVSAWSRMDETDLDREQFKDLFPESFDFETIKAKARQFIFVHGSDDPFCPLDQAKWLAQQTGGEIHVIEGGQHLGESRQPEFPELVEVLKKYELV